MKRFALLLLFIILWLAGCTQVPSSPNPVESTGEPTRRNPAGVETKSAHPTRPASTSTSVPTATSRSIAARRPTVTPTPTPDTGIHTACFGIQPSLPAAVPYTGTVILESLDAEVQKGISLYDLQRKSSVDLSRIWEVIQVSPNRELFAYSTLYDLRVYSSDGKLIKTLPWKRGWGYFGGWLDNEQVLIAKSDKEVPDSNWDIYPRTILVLNVFTREEKLLPPEYPDISETNPLLEWQTGTTIYHPSLTRVIYPGTLRNAAGEPDGGGYILYNLETKKRIAQVPALTFNYHFPVWAPDGSKWTAFGEGEFYLVTLDGAVTELTHMNPPVDFEHRNRLVFDAVFLSWSPDGQRVAFWLENRKSGSNTFAILDTSSGEVLDTCIPAGYVEEKIRLFPFPVWSPDGKNIVIAANYQPEDGGYQAVIVDLESQTAFHLADNLFPVGWLTAP